MRAKSLEMVYELAKKDSRVVFIGSDLGVGTLKQFKKDFPERFFMEGISEAHIVGMAAGLALDGKIPYVNTIATFFSRRSYEQVALDLCLHKTKVRLISNGGGLVYAPLGPTHLSIEDISILRTLPNMTIVAVADEEEMEMMMSKTLDVDGPIYIRLGKGDEPKITQKLLAENNLQYEFGKAYQYKSGKDALLLTTGIMLHTALAAYEILKGKGVDIGIVHVPVVKPLDEKPILKKLSESKVVVSLEENVKVGGFGSAIADLIAENSLRNIEFFKKLGLPDKFPDQYGSQKSLLAHFKLDAESVSSVIAQQLGKL